MHTRDRSKRKYGFGDLTAPTKLECLELVERENEVGSARIAKLMEIPLSHASKIMRDYWSQGLLHRELNTKRRRGVCYLFSLTETGKGKLTYFRREKNLMTLFKKQSIEPGPSSSFSDDQ